MKDLIVKLYNEQPVRIINQDGEPWFVAKDIAKILGYRSASAMTKNLYPSAKCTINIFDENLKRNINTIIIGKAGVYRSIFDSKSKIADNFEKWVVNECVPYFYQNLQSEQNYCSNEYLFKQITKMALILQDMTKVICKLNDDVKMLKEQYSDDFYSENNNLDENKEINANQVYLPVYVPEKLAEIILANNPHVIKA